MPTLHLDGREIACADGATILAAAHQAGIAIPTLCHRPGLHPSGSCMICAVRVGPAGRFLPACAARAEAGMQVVTDSEELRRLRRQALELLLSAHVGDCLGPCERACPAGVRVPKLLRHLMQGEWLEAEHALAAQLPLPALLGRICHRPCEAACRRAQMDQTLAIGALEGALGDHGLSLPPPPSPSPNGKRVLIAGSGLSALSAAAFLARRGFACELLERRDLAGGSLLDEFPEEQLPRALLGAEIARLEALGVRFRLGCELGRDFAAAAWPQRGDALLLATGAHSEALARSLGLTWAAATGVTVDRRFATGRPGVWAAGRIVRPGAKAVHRATAGRDAAAAIARQLGHPLELPPELTHVVQLGRLREGELAQFAKGVNPAAGTLDLAHDREDQAAREARRCLHCDCSAVETCELRQLSQCFAADAKAGGNERADFRREAPNPYLFLEPGKCILCGQCLAVDRQAAAPLGLRFVQRAYATRVSARRDTRRSPELHQTALAVAAVCPTGALVLRAWEDPEGAPVDADPQ